MEQENEQRRRLEAASRQAALNQQKAQQQQQQEQQQVARNNKINVRKQQVRLPSIFIPKENSVSFNLLLVFRFLYLVFYH